MKGLSISMEFKKRKSIIESNCLKRGNAARCVVIYTMYTCTKHTVKIGKNTTKL